LTIDSAVHAMKLIFLGTGTSMGVPLIGCRCSTCRSADPRNKRMRASVLVQAPGGNILIDTTPEMRMQLLRAGVERIDAVLYTHAHADHIFGLDDLRIFPRRLGHAVPTYGERAVFRAIRQSFSYAFNSRADRMPPGSIPQLDLHVVRPGRSFDVLGVECMPIRLLHGPYRVLGFRFGPLAYCTDVSAIPERSMRLLSGLEVLVLDALRREPHPTHFSLSESLAVIRQLRPKRAYLTHMSHRLEHRITCSRLPAGVTLAYDGLEIDF
jgi:phosphoribosyl 1,2-cyclic phosphate phosphodiesterase